MIEFLQEYLAIAVFLGLAVGIGAALLAAPFVIAPNEPDKAKLAPYECGFEPFEDARMPFNVQFYLVAILFIIFDLEIAFLFPWAAAFGTAGVFGFWAVMLFLAVLTIGFLYEWRKGALDWQ